MSLLNEISTAAHSSAFGNTQDVTSNVDATYGEICENGISAILSKLVITPNDLFLDLGVWYRACRITSIFRKKYT